MKHVLLVADGMPDEPIPSLNGKTPLEHVATPNLDALAGRSLLGVTYPIPDGFLPGSDIGNLSLMGYDPHVYFTGRSPLEVIDMGVDLQEGDVAFRMNFVTMSGLPDRPQIEDYSAGHITDAEAFQLLAEVRTRLRADDIHFARGVSYRHAMIWNKGPKNLKTTPPHDIQGVPTEGHWPEGEAAERLSDMIRRSWEILAGSSVNRIRSQKGEPAANSIWFWGQGTRPALPLFEKTYGIKGAAVSAVPLLRGIGICAGLKILKVPGMTGWVDTNYKGKVEYTLDFLAKEGDFVLLHVEAIDECGHVGDLEKKCLAIELFDREVVKPLMEGLAKVEPHRVLVTSDHLTYLSRKTHVAGPVPFIAFDSTKPMSPKSLKFGETSARAAGVTADPCHDLLPRFLDGRLFG
ncbi:MAG: cofactor-independent phosphoglycerate mutase [Nitrospirae bacterium]|nr:cofactor-independent phosphoglycerate mutase [Nitrospirota bacterium]